MVIKKRFLSPKIYYQCISLYRRIYWSLDHICITRFIRSITRITFDIYCPFPREVFIIPVWIYNTIFQGSLAQLLTIWAQWSSWQAERVVWLVATEFLLEVITQDYNIAVMANLTSNGPQVLIAFFLNICTWLF